MKRRISYFYNVLFCLMYCTKLDVKHKVHQIHRKQIDSHMHGVQNVHQWHEHKHANLLAIGQPRHQPATAPSLAIAYMQQTLSQLINVMNATVTSYLRHILNK